VPKVALAVRLVARHAETVLVGGEVSLCGRAVPVGEVVVVRPGVVGVIENVVAEIISENMVNIVLCARCLVVSRVGMVRLRIS